MSHVGLPTFVRFRRMSRCQATGHDAVHGESRNRAPQRPRPRVRRARRGRTLLARGARAQHGARPLDRLGGDRGAAGRAPRRRAAGRRTPRAPGAMGRPPVLVALDRAAGVALGLDFGKRHLRVAVADLAHEVLAERHEQLDADLPAAEAIALAARLVGEVLDEAGAAQRRRSPASGWACPGPVHRPIGRARRLDDPAGLGRRAGGGGDVRRRSATRSRSRTTPASARSASGCGARASGADDMAYLKLATGIGAGLIVRGRPYGGSGGTAGEIGHTVIDPAGPVCRCGNRGCLETLAGSSAILGSVARRVRGAGHAARRDRLRARRARREPAGDRRRRRDDRPRRGHAVQPAQPAAGRRRRRSRGRRRAAARAARRVRCGAARSAPRPTTSQVLPGALGDRAEVLGAVALVLRRGARLLPRARGA